jgi:hypothetical protein
MKVSSLSKEERNSQRTMKVEITPIFRLSQTKVEVERKQQLAQPLPL